MNAPNHKKDECPKCGYAVDSATELHHEPVKPSAGDFSLCLSCGSLLRFDRELLLGHASADELDELDDAQRSEIRKAQRYILQRGPITK